MPSFQDLRLIEPLLRALTARSYTTPTPIQQQAIPPLLAGRDLLGIAQTGTGKTAAFALPILQRLAQDPRRPEPRSPRVLVLSPTRELASQIGDSFTAYGRFLGLRNTVIFGGVGQNPQVQAMRNGIDICVATPGRLLDLIQQRHVSLRSVEIFVLDEADRMLDMGFLPDVERVIRQLPEQRHSMLFSATMPPNIQRLAHGLLDDPVRVEVTPQATTAEKVEQFVYFVRDKKEKPELLRAVLEKPEIERVLVFTRTKHGADKVVKHLKKHGEHAMAIHGNKSQSAREKALDEFRDGGMRVLVATDIAARGIDVPGITHVINYDLPNVSEQYVHRIGRTARAGRSGVAFSFCAPDEREFLRDIEKLIRQRLQPTGERPQPSTPEHVPAATREPAPQHRSHGRPQHAPGHRQGHGSRHGGHRGQQSHRGPRPSQHPSGPRPQPTHKPQREAAHGEQVPFGFLPDVEPPRQPTGHGSNPRTQRPDDRRQEPRQPHGRPGGQPQHGQTQHGQPRHRPRRPHGGR